MKVAKRHKPWMSIHFTHPSEITPEVEESTARLADSGDLALAELALGAREGQPHE